MEPSSQTWGNVQWDSLMQELGISKPPHRILEADVVGKSLESAARWQEFYDAYSRWTGFTTRKNNVRKDDHGNECHRLWVCSREGFRRPHPASRKKAEKSQTRSGCKARLSVTKFRSDNAWRATVFDVQHNHELASLSEIQFLRAHRRAPEPGKESRGFETCDVLDCVALEPGARSRLGFLRKDVFNELEARRNEVGRETDAEGALGYLTCLAVRDPNFFCRFTAVEEGEDRRLGNIFWSDSVSRRDYETFGDVLVLDVSFRLNGFDRPVVMLAGVNNHRKATVFGVAVLLDETVETYQWVLELFLMCMDKKLPKVVLTDGGYSIRSAVSTVMLTVVHRVCTWHDAAAVGYDVSSEDFKRQFSELVCEYYTEAEFEDKWSSMIATFKLELSDWARSIYENRRSWAETFLRGNFFGGVRTTKICESMEPFMNRFADIDHLMRDFVAQIDAGVAAIRRDQARDDYESHHGKPDIPQGDVLKTYYCQFAKAYTKNMYESVAKEIKWHHSYSVVVTATEHQSVESRVRVFRLNEFLVGELRHQVKYDSNDGGISCTCLLFETDGIPCGHIFTVMKFLNMVEIPSCLFTQRWKKSARDHNSPPDETPTTIVPRGEDGSLRSEFNTLVSYASKHEDTYKEARQELARLAERFRRVVEARGTTQMNHDSEAVSENMIPDSDHETTRSKGRGCDSQTLTPPASKKLCSREHETVNTTQSPSSGVDASAPTIRHFAQLSPRHLALPASQLPSSASDASMVRHFAQLSQSYTQPTAQPCSRNNSSASD